MQKLRPYLQLLRLPAVFTAMADIFLGYLLNFQHELYPLKAEFVLLLAASSGLYLAGMVLNDYFDRHIDAQERSERPIPSGRVSAKDALLLGLGLLAVGIGAAAVVGKQSLLIGGLLAGCVLAYDAFFKRTLLGPLVMGGCRFFNVMLGASAADPVWHMPQLHVAAGLGIYIVGVTWFGRTEARQSSRVQLAAAMGTVNLGLAVLVALVRNHSGAAEPMLIYFVLGVIFLTINRRLVSAVMDPSPAKVQAAIKLMLMSLVMLDATLVYFQRAVAWEAAIVACLLIPATLLGRWIRVT